MSQNKRATKTEIYESLIKQLRDMGAEIAHFEDLVNDYVSLWEIKNKLIKDIKKRGITYEGVSSQGHLMIKNNQSVKEVVNVNKQMLLILEKLGLKTDEVDNGEDDL